MQFLNKLSRRVATVSVIKLVQRSCYFAKAGKLICANVFETTPSIPNKSRLAFP